jgi:hypothetical protein
LRIEGLATDPTTMSDPKQRTIPLSDLGRDASAAMAKLDSDPEPWFVTDGGEVVAVLMHPDVYDDLIDRIEELAGTLESLLQPGVRSED